MNNRIRLWEYWEQLAAKLKASTRLMTILQGGKVYLEGEDYSLPEGPENKLWGRLIITPATNPWLDKVGIGPTRSIRFLTRAEVHPGTSTLHVDVHKMLDGLQDECTVVLEGFVHPSMTYVRAAQSLWMARPPQVSPLWDDDRGVWYSSAEWRAEVVAP